MQPNPPHVSYTYNPTMDFPADGTTAGHAYWLYGVELRDSSGTAPLGTIDVRSEGFGVGDPPASATQFGAGVLTGGQLGALPFTSESKTWGAAPKTPAKDALDIQATNVSQVQSVVASCLDYQGERRRVVYTELNFPSVSYVWKAEERQGAPGEAHLVGERRVHQDRQPQIPRQRQHPRAHAGKRQAADGQAGRLRLTVG